MRETEAHRMLKENGFSFVREARHGALFTDGVSILQCARVMKLHNERNFVAQINRAVKKREETMQTTQNGPVKTYTKEMIQAEVNKDREARRTIVQNKPLTTIGEALMAKKETPAPAANGASAHAAAMRSVDAKYKQEIEFRILQMREEEELSWEAIAKQLNKEGKPNLVGKPWTTSAAYQTGQRLGLVEKRKPANKPPVVKAQPARQLVSAPPAVAAPQPQPKPVTSQQHLSALAALILHDTSLSDTKKVKMLTDLL